jgi:hypothetical protein
MSQNSNNLSVCAGARADLWRNFCLKGTFSILKCAGGIFDKNDLEVVYSVMSLMRLNLWLGKPWTLFFVYYWFHRQDRSPLKC